MEIDQIFDFWGQFEVAEHLEPLFQLFDVPLCVEILKIRDEVARIEDSVVEDLED